MTSGLIDYSGRMSIQKAYRLIEPKEIESQN
jgi:hypothetical protein